MTKTKDKPPTQTMLVEGIDAQDPELTAEQVEAARVLMDLSRLPPFQMFIAERDDAPAGADSQKFAYERAHLAGRGIVGEYEEWHSRKGLWPHEKPNGRPR